MAPLIAFFLFTLERARCVILALATIVLVKVAAILFLAPLIGTVSAPNVSEAAAPAMIVPLP